MLGLVWPSRLNPAPSGLARLGRVLHWLAYALGALFIVSAALNAETGDLYVPVFFALVCFVFGRALRYVLAAE